MLDSKGCYGRSKILASWQNNCCKKGGWKVTFGNLLAQSAFTNTAVQMKQGSRQNLPTILDLYSTVRQSNTSVSCFLFPNFYVLKVDNIPQEQNRTVQSSGGWVFSRLGDRSCRQPVTNITPTRLIQHQGRSCPNKHNPGRFRFSRHQ